MQRKKFFVPNSTLNRSMPFDAVQTNKNWNTRLKCVKTMQNEKLSKFVFIFIKNCRIHVRVWARQNCVELWDFNTCLYTVIEQYRFYTIVRHFVIRHFLTVVLLLNWYHRLGWSRHDEKSSHESVHQSRWVFCSK